MNDYKILYEEDNLVLVKYTKELTNKDYGPYSFGLKEDLYNIYSFPVNQSLLKKTNCIKLLRKFIKINKEYSNKYNLEDKNQKIYKKMIKVLECE